MPKHTKYANYAKTLLNEALINFFFVFLFYFSITEIMLSNAYSKG